MATQRYKTSLLVLKKIRTSEIFFNMRKEISHLQEAMESYIITGVQTPMKYQDISL